MNTLFVSDLDGTLLRMDQTVSPYTLNTINHLMTQGVHFTYATARSFVSASKVTQGLQLTLPVIVYNGAIIVDPTNGQVLESYLLSKTALMPVLMAIKQLQLRLLVYAMVEGRERVSWIMGEENVSIQAYLDNRQEDPRLRPVHTYEELFAGDLFYLTVLGSRVDMEAVRPAFTKSAYLHTHLVEDTYRLGEYWLEGYRHDATKAEAVAKVRRLAGAERLVCFGDNINDIPMFDVSDACYAVANAKPELKAMATQVIGSHEADGVAEWLAAWWAKKYGA